MKKRKIAIFLSLVMVLQTTTIVSASERIATNATVSEEGKQYIIITESDNAYEEVVEEIGQSVTEDIPLLNEQNIIVAELEENEVWQLEQNEEIMVEEDIIISASTIVKDEYEEALNTDAFKKREQIRKKKEELFTETETNENAEIGFEWNMQAINADEIDTPYETKMARVKVAVLDSGIDYIEGIELSGYENLVDEEQDVPFIFQDLTGHGTGIASIIAGSEEGDVLGVNPNVQLYSVRVLDEHNTAPLSRVIEGIYWCVDNDIDIINMSFGTSVYSQAMEQAVKEAYDAGVLMIAAAGNENGNVEYPAAFDEVMAVASVNEASEISDFSNIGEEVDVAAPGEKIRVSSFFNGNIITHGTSIAVPHVTGVASLLWEKDLTKTNEFIRQLIDYSAKKLEETDECGLLDAGYALEIYDEFSEKFTDMAESGEIDIQENTEQPESFECIADDEAYVEGRWNKEGHQGAIDAGSTGFTEEQIKILKRGAVFPDREASGWAGGSDYPRWHGKWLTKAGNPLNYIAAYEMITTIALENGDVSSFTSADEFWGLGANIFSALKKDIKNANYADAFSAISVSDTSENRKYLLWGCAIHTITDVFAHSTTTEDGTLIKHDGDDSTPSPDLVTYYPKRYETAVKVAEYSLECLREEVQGDGNEIVKALKSVYTSSTKFKVLKVKKYANENGYSDSILSLATISEPKS